MKISREWLQTFFDAKLPDSTALAEALTFHAFEIESVEGDILDVKITPNRGHDCLSHRGIAKEISAILKIPLSHDPLLAQELAGSFSMNFPINVTIENPDLCSRYIAWTIAGVKVGPSPKWLMDRLEAIGQRSINNIVDATNFVMFNIGQPLHAFDADKLKADGKGHSIAVRSAKSAEKMRSLDGKDYTFTDSMLLIVDKVSDTPIGIAGVKGGEASGVGPETTGIILESANFNGASIRKTAQTLRLRTDASDRFQQVISPELAAYGIRAAAKLIIELAGGELAGFADVYPKPQEKKEIVVSTTKINAVLGTALDEATIGDSFSRLGFSFEKKGDSFTVIAPPERLDLEIEEDLIEEVARIVGYDAIPTIELAKMAKKPLVNENFYAAEKTREDLMAKGYSEVYTSVFAEKGERAVLNKVDGAKPYLRANLTDGLADAFKRNVGNKDLIGVPEVRLFEVGSVWEGGRESIKVATVVEAKKGHSHTEHALKPVEGSAYDDLPISTTERYVSFSKYPFIVRDIALWVPESTKAEDALTEIREKAGNLLVRSSLFDEFEKGGKKSFAFRLVFQSFEKTLTDAEVNAVMDQVHKAVAKKGWEVR